MKEKVVLFGSSELGKEAFFLLNNDYDILYFVDNDFNKQNKYFCGKLTVSPSQLADIIFDKIIIASQYYSEIIDQLYKLNIKNIYTFFYYIKRNSLEKNPLVKKVETLDLTISDINCKNIIQNNRIEYTSNTVIRYGKKNVLFFALIFPPSGGSGVQRSLKFVKYLYDFGWNPIVITLDESYNFWGIDYSLLNELPKDINIVKIKQPYLNAFEINKEDAIPILNLTLNILGDNEIRKQLITKLIENDILYRKYILEPDMFVSWVVQVLKTIEQFIDFDQIDVMYTTGPSYSNHYNGYYLKKKYNIPWVSDFRDEWTNSPYVDDFYKNDDFRLSLHRDIEKSIVNFSDKVITVTPNSSQNYRDIFNLSYSKVETITNGFDEDDFCSLSNNCIKNEKFTILYFGTLYLNRDLSVILNSITKLIEKNYIENSYIVFKIIGESSNQIKETMIKKDKFKILSFIEYLPHLECLEEGNKADMLVLYVGEDDKYRNIYTGKFFEYLRLQKTILSISPKDSEIEKVLNEIDSGLSFNTSNYERMGEFIFENYINWKYNKEKFKTGDILKYERKILTQKLAELFDEVEK